MIRRFQHNDDFILIERPTPRLIQISAVPDAAEAFMKRAMIILMIAERLAIFAMGFAAGVIWLFNQI